MEQKIDNYQIQAQRARQRFLTYDQQQIIAKSPLTFDDDYLYLPVLDRTCMIRRQTGELFWQAVRRLHPKPRPQRRHDHL